ncbi:SDR family NAD(P)-dependent oxidoreductase [Nonomuraea endophytica]|uniref:NAD(P)-dependent dehydrogenase (Short-subunit alcohol dehydrogenase family) n=1 Tax=Nonomuraea endophytica TaxID=714136 RepID=A0A7W7ZXT3_9ACTN|nr:SDR family NAD(P)-dependent oxidoreductase [Nonomuraea endophytica]MBB5075764.1 NAD(P)-dependent dehydrogenase (short-subunit alcohol dehydrogenase family) [Nonomuraea endophytica]
MITVITGASAGIGAAAAGRLSALGHEVVLVGRDAVRLKAVAGGLTGPKAEVLTCDFTSLDDVRRLAGVLRERYERIDVLANNAGVHSKRRQVTGDGHELMFQVNHLAPFLLTHSLTDRVDKVVTTTSMAGNTGRLDPGDLSRERRRWNAWMQYGDTKQANMLFTQALATRGVRATCFHPGIIRTGFAGDTLLMRFYLAIPGVAKPPEAGARTLVHLASSEGEAGRYYVKEKPARGRADHDLAERLWTASLSALGG